MKKPSWQHMRESLRVRHAAPSPMSAADFWANARPRLEKCRATCTPAASAAPLAFWRGYRRWALAAAAALLFSTGVVIVEWRGGARSSGQFSGISALERVDVWVDYQNILVVNSARHRGTVVWVSGMNDRGEPN